MTARMHQVPDDSWAALGRRLRAAGLGERAVRHCFGVTCSIHAPLAAMARRDVGPVAPCTRAVSSPPAALLAHLFVAGSPVDAGAVARLLGPGFERDLEQLTAAGLARVDAGVVTAEVTILPVGDALVVTDRADRMRGADLVACPDDSAMHTIGMVPARAARPGLRWLDVGTGAAIVPLARPGAASAVVATDVHERALAMARLSMALSGRSDIALRQADLLAGAERDGPWHLVTFNAPIPASVMPAPGDTPLYRRGPDDILDRFWRDVRALIASGPEAPGGVPGEAPREVIVHSWQPLADYPASLALPGQVTAVRYTPPDRAPAFGVTIWRPDAPPEARLMHVPLTADAPHLTRAALDPAI
jgi:hypothetical protein